MAERAWEAAARIAKSDSDFCVSPQNPSARTVGGIGSVADSEFATEQTGTVKEISEQLYVFDAELINISLARLCNDRLENGNLR